MRDFGIPQRFLDHGSRKDVMAEIGLTAPDIARQVTGLVATIDGRFAAVQTGLDKYRRNTALGFALYEELTPADRRRLAQQIDALAEPLSTVAAKVSGA